MEEQNILISLPSSEDTNKYSNCKIYCIYCYDEYYYIGATRTELRYRLSHHKQDSKKYTNRRVYRHINNIGWDNVDIKCLETFTCSSRQEMLQKENEYIQAVIGDDYCLNNILAHLTEEELKEKQAHYRQEHRDKILEYKKLYRQENAEKISEYNKKYVQENSEEVKQQKKNYNQENKEKIAAKCKEYNEAHKEELAAYKKQYAEEHKDEIKQKSKEFREKNKDKISKKGKQYYAENKEACQERMKKYQKENRETLKQKAKERREKKKQENPDVSVSCNVCGGSYQEYRKNRHISSKKHQDKLNS